jgi:hypothetical protein
MQTILDILKLAGGFRPTLYLKIENPPYTALVIEATPEPGPMGLPLSLSRTMENRTASRHDVEKIEFL